MFAATKMDGTPVNNTFATANSHTHLDTTHTFTHLELTHQHLIHLIRLDPKYPYVGLKWLCVSGGFVVGVQIGHSEYTGVSSFVAGVNIRFHLQSIQALCHLRIIFHWHKIVV